jgi:hypothetical protein
MAINAITYVVATLAGHPLRHPKSSATLSPHRCLRLFRVRRLGIAAFGAEISFTTAEFGEDDFQDTAQAVPRVLAVLRCVP